MDAISAAGMTPLHVTALHSQKATMELLLNAGAEVNRVASGGWMSGLTSLHLAARGYGAKREIIELLLSRGADVHAKDRTGQTPLNLAANDGSVSVAECLIAHTANVRAKDNAGATPVTLAQDRVNADCSAATDWYRPILQAKRKDMLRVLVEAHILRSPLGRSTIF